MQQLPLDDLDPDAVSPTDDAPVHQPVTPLPVEIRRSARRRRTVSARVEDGRILVLVPERLSRARERELVDQMVARVEAQRARAAGSEQDLMRRATMLSKKYLGGRARPSEVVWVTNQRARWGSCTPATGRIRVSSRLQGMPVEVVDYVLLHELAHLIVPRHGPQFWAQLAGYPHLERARGFLDGVAHADRAAGNTPGPQDDPPDAQTPERISD